MLVLLPEDMVEYFELVKVDKTKDTLDVTLEERDRGVDGYEDGQLRPQRFLRGKYSPGLPCEGP